MSESSVREMVCGSYKDYEAVEAAFIKKPGSGLDICVNIVAYIDRKVTITFAFDPDATVCRRNEGERDRCMQQAMFSFWWPVLPWPKSSRLFSLSSILAWL